MKILISIMIATILAAMQYHFDSNNENSNGNSHDNNKETTNKYSRSLAIFVCVSILSYMGQILLFDGGISNNNIISSSIINEKKDIQELINNIEIGEAPF